MSPVLYVVVITSFYFLLIVADQENARDTARNDGRSNNFVMSNTSELRKHEQLEELANNMFDEYWHLYLMTHPQTATMLGDHRFDDKLTSYSLKSYEKKKVMLNEFLERAVQMLPLAPEGCREQKNLQLFITDLQNKLDNLMSGSYLFPLSKMYTPEMSLRYLLKYVKLKEAKDFWNLIFRYKAMEMQIDEQIELMREGIHTNFTLNIHSLPSSRRNYTQNIENSPFYKPFLNISSSVSPEDVAEIQNNASHVILNHLIPAFEKLEEFLEIEYRPNARPGIGVGSLPNGKEFYRQRLANHLTENNVSAEQIHSMGLEEVSRISLEMDEVIHSLSFNMSRKEFNEYLRNDKNQYFSTSDEALDVYRDVLKNVIPAKLPKVFKYIPDKELVIQKVPKEFAVGPHAYYTMPSPDNSTPGTFFLDTSNLKNLPKYDVMTLSLHEGIPGHHFQQAYTMEQENVPDFRKYGISSTAYTEGWALYAEYLGYEMELFEDPYLRFGHLSYEMLRACRLVVDTGIHVLGWTRQQAIEYMANNIAFSLDAITREVDRYITWPGQACSYKYGEIKIKQLRRKAEDSLGEQFDLKEFHDIILRNKAPFMILENEIDRYISKTRNETQI